MTHILQKAFFKHALELLFKIVPIVQKIPTKKILKKFQKGVDKTTGIV